MPEFEARWPCPVCPGVNLEKAPVSENLLLDHCPRCGGVWFDAGEVDRLPECNPGDFWAVVSRRSEVVRALCQHCQALVPRDTDHCPACNKAQQFKCPTCDEPMQKVGDGDLRLDHCSRCKGLWFDHHELAGIWERAATRMDPQRPPDGSDTIAHIAGGVLEVAAYNPVLAIYGAEAAGRIAVGAAEVLVHAGPGLLEGAADLAAAAFEAIVEIIGSIFS